MCWSKYCCRGGKDEKSSVSYLSDDVEASVEGNEAVIVDDDEDDDDDGNEAVDDGNEAVDDDGNADAAVSVDG